jgi:hypothetical protein
MGDSVCETHDFRLRHRVTLVVSDDRRGEQDAGQLSLNLPGFHKAFLK